MMRILLLGCLVLLSGCAKSFYADQCAKAGAPIGSAANQSCVQQAIDAGKREGQAALGAGALVGAVVATDQPGAPVTTASPPSAQPQRLLCPNGSYVYGTMCQLAPDGSYVGGPVQQAPNGSYVGGTGPIRLCPDGSYVSGNSCRLMPDGSYVGQ